MSGGMRIDLLRVHGFGHFTGYELELKPGLNLVYGPNEAGKSTLLAFIRGVLFGWERRGRSEPGYEPEAGAFGGELCLSTAAGPLVVRRVADGRKRTTVTVLSPEGGELPPSRREEALANVSRELFREVFAFSLEELSSFEKLAKEDGVTRALFAAGLRGARRLPEVEKHLEKRAGELFKVSGTKPELNQVFRQLDETRARLEKLKDRPEQYAEERERLAALERKQEETTVLRDSVARELETLSRWEAALGPLAELTRVRAELATLPDLSSFPAQGVARLEELSQRLKEARALQARAEAELAVMGEKLAHLSSDTGVRAREQELRGALGAFTEVAEALRALPGRRAALEVRRREVEHSFRGLGLTVEVAGLLGLELGPAARGSLEVLADSLSKAQMEQREAELTHERARAERARIEGVLVRLQAERAKLPDVTAAAVRQRQTAWGRSNLLRVERDHVAAQEAEHAQRLQALRAQAEPELGLAPGLLPVGVGGVGGVGLGAGRGNHSGVGGGAMALLGAILLVVPMAWGYRRGLKSHRQGVEARKFRQLQREQEEARVRSALDMLRGHRARLEREWEAAAREAGVAPEAPLAELAGLETALAEALRQAERVEHLEREREARDAEHASAAREEQSSALAVGQADARMKGLQTELAMVLEARGFPTDLTPQRALALWRDAAELRQRLVELEAEERGLLADEARCEAVVSKLREEARAAGLPEGSAESLAGRISRALEEQETRETDAKSLRAQRDAGEAERARLRSLKESEERAVAGLLSQGGCDTEEAFRQRARQAELFTVLTEQVRELTLRVESVTSVSEAAAREAILAEGGEQPLKQRLGELRMQAPALVELLKRLHTDAGGAQTQLKMWEGDEQIAALRMEEERLKARAAELATRYARERLALELLGRARRRFEEEQQPRVIQLASEHFATLTQGRYRRVFIPAGDSRALRVSKAGKEWSPEQLSRGTREQLYLAFRLAVIQEFGETKGVLPIIVDDVLVNFDRERTRGALTLLARLSERHQIIAFTCHPWLRESFEAEGAKVLELPSGRGAAEVALGEREGLGAAWAGPA